jgi:hypothetical protein
MMPVGQTRKRSMSEKLKDAMAEWMDKLVKEHARELIIGLLKQYGVTIILSQVISILRATKDDGFIALSNDLVIALDNHESKNERKEIGKKVGFVPASAEKSAKKASGLMDHLFNNL